VLGYTTNRGGRCWGEGKEEAVRKSVLRPRSRERYTRWFQKRNLKGYLGSLCGGNKRPVVGVKASSGRTAGAPGEGSCSQTKFRCSIGLLRKHKELGAVTLAGVGREKSVFAGEDPRLARAKLNDARSEKKEGKKRSHRDVSVSRKYEQG